MYLDPFFAATSSVLAVVWQLLNTKLAIAFVGGLTGALGGALGAQWIAEHVRSRETRLKELRYTNAAIMVAHTTCNTALTFKKQLVGPMVEAFRSAQAAQEKHENKRRSGQLGPDESFHFQMDLQKYSAPVVPIETLKQAVYEQISAIGRPLALVAMIEQSLIGLEKAIAKRDSLSEKFESGAFPKNLYAEYYFGLPLPDGSIHREYADIVEAIASYVDDLAFFSYQLCLDLMKHGGRVRDALTKRQSARVPQVVEVDFSGPIKNGLMPDAESYSSWLSDFMEKPRE